MPENLNQNLSEQELVDLVAYLMTLRKSASAAANLDRRP